MAWKAEISPSSFVAPSRRFFFREILGIFEAVVAVLVFLSLLSAGRGEQWIGAFGAWAARDLTFVLGIYVSYAFPAMLAVNAWNSIFGKGSLIQQYRSLVRGAGGLVLLTSACALSAIHASFGTDDAARLFEAGGMVGAFMIDAEGLDLTQYLGKVGALILLYGFVLVGLLLFTETLVRDASRAALKAAGAVLWPARLVEPIGRAASAVTHPAQWVWRVLSGEFFRGMNFREKSASRVFAQAPIIDLHPVGAAPRRVMPPAPRALRAPEPPPVDEEDFDIDEEEAEEEREEARNSVEEPRGRSGGMFRLGFLPMRKFEDSAPEQEAEDEEESEEQETEDAADGWAEDERPAIARSRQERASEEAELFARDREPDGGDDDSDSSLPSIFRLRRKKKQAAAGPEPTPEDQPDLPFKKAEFALPSMELLQPSPPTVYRMTQEEAEELSIKIEQTLAQFKIEVEVMEVVQGPTVTRFAMRIAPGIRVSKILALENDLALALKAQHVRILAPIPGQAAVGIEVPNKKTNPVFLRDLLESPSFKESKSSLTFALGRNISGEPVIADLAQMPHLLIAGATGAGKSVCLNTIIASILFRNSPDKVKLVMIDPKRVELSIYQAIPHLLAPVVSEPRKAAAALAWTVDQMEKRYKLLAELAVRNIDGYNAIAMDTQPNKKAIGRALKFMPNIVVVIDELADLMLVAKNEVEEYIIRLAQMARAVGIHLILATQRPSVNVITGIIKANFPSRIAFRVSSKVDSRTILDLNGAEALLGRGDMLYSPGGVKPFRIQGAFVSDAEIESLADYIRAQEKVRYEKEDFEPEPTPAQRAKAQLMLQALPGSPAPRFRAVSEDEEMPPDTAAEIDLDGLDEEGEEEESEGGASEAETVVGRNPFAPPPMPVVGRAAAAPLLPADMESLNDEDLFDVALRLVIESRKASVSYIQRRLKIGYARAGRVMDMMEERGIVGPYQGSKPRDLIIDPATYLREMQADLDDGE